MTSLIHNKQRGFTLIEMMVSLALFTVVITIAAGAFLSLIGNNGKLQGEQSVMTTLSFALDSMSREIRTGSHYYCRSAAPVMDTELTRDCATSANTLSFTEGGSSLSAGAGSERIAYSYDGNLLTRQVGEDGAEEPIVSDEIKLKNVKFIVTNTADDDQVQPTVTIVIEAADPDDATKVYTLQTTVVQRQLDI